MPISPFYGSPAEERGALRRAAARSGCRVVEGVERSMAAPGGRTHAVGRVVCGDGWGAARLVLALAIEDADTDGARELAGELWRGLGDRRAFVERVQTFVRERIEFVRDAGEVFGGPDYLFELGAGDCEDQARVVYALLRAGGVPVRMAFLHRGGDPTHAVAQAEIGGRPQWVETTIAAELGEHPNRAAVRLGLAGERTDLAEGVRTMSEKALAPVPARFRKVNAPAQVEHDAQALERLGFLAAGVPRVSGDPADLAFRAAVLAFQTHAGIHEDGLIGPQTRRALAGMLPLDDFGMGYVAATAGPRNEKMVAAWPSLIEAARALESAGQIPRLSDEGLAISMAIANGETLLSNPPFVRANNWGNVTYNPNRGATFVAWGFLESGDLNGQGQRVTRRFQAYPSLVEGAKDFLRIKLGGGMRGAEGRAAIRAAFAAADVDAIALAMFRNKYFEGLPQDTDRDGVPGTENDRAQQYAALIRRDLPAARASAPAGMKFGGGGGAGVAGLVLLALGVGGAVWMNR